jgi:hypothetical protein
MASGSTPIIPPSWTVPAWFIDPANSATCASDTNSGTAATCTGGCSGAVCTSGIGPLRTFQELNVHRWGCLGNPSACPRFTGHNQTYTIQFISSQTVNTDPVYLAFSEENGSAVIVDGVLGAAQQVCTTTLAAGGAAKSRTAPQLLNVKFTTCAGAATGQLVVNTTHPSRAWIYSAGVGGSWNMSQPLTPYTPPVYNPSGTEVDTWTAAVGGDSVTVYTPVQINLIYYVPVFGDFNQGTFANPPTFYQATAWDPGGPFSDNAEYGPVMFVESQIQRATGLQTNDSTVIGMANVYNVGGLSYPGASLIGQDLLVFSGGVLNVPGGLALGAALVDQDIIIGNGGTDNQLAEAEYGFVYVDTSTVLTANLAWKNLTSAAVVWGPGTLNATGRVTYPSGAGGAAAAFKISTLEVNGQSATCIAQPGAAAIGACNQSITAAHLDTNGGATSDCMVSLGGGSFCNYGP